MKLFPSFLPTTIFIKVGVFHSSETIDESIWTVKGIVKGFLSFYFLNINGKTIGLIESCAKQVHKQVLMAVKTDNKLISRQKSKNKDIMTSSDSKRIELENKYVMDGITHMISAGSRLSGKEKEKKCDEVNNLSYPRKVTNEINELKQPKLEEQNNDEKFDKIDYTKAWLLLEKYALTNHELYTFLDDLGIISGDELMVLDANEIQQLKSYLKPAQRKLITVLLPYTSPNTFSPTTINSTISSPPSSSLPAIKVSKSENSTITNSTTTSVLQFPTIKNSNPSPNLSNNTTIIASSLLPKKRNSCIIS